MVQHVAAIENEGGLAHAGIDALVVQARKLIPLCDDAQRMCAGTCLRSRHRAVSSGNIQGHHNAEAILPQFVPVLPC